MHQKPLSYDIKNGIVVLLSVYLLSLFVFNIAWVSGESMNPTLHNNQPLLLLKYTHWLHKLDLFSYKRGDVIIFRIPKESPYAYEKRLGFSYRPFHIKRIVAIAGDQVQIENDTLYINHHPINEIKRNDGFMNSMPLFTVPPHSVYVLGDNRIPGESLDSRSYGSISIDDISGIAHWSIWPPTFIHDSQSYRNSYENNN